MDLEAMEFFVRSVMLGAGARALEAFLAERLGEEEAPVCANGHVARPMALHERRAKTIRTILGPVPIERGRFVCGVCGAVRYGADEALGIERTVFSPGARRMMARAGACEPFAQAAEALALYASLHTDAKDIERVAESVGRKAEDWAQHERAVARALGGHGVAEAPETLYVSFDGTGTPVRREELQGVKGKNGAPRTREAKVGCVFTQTALDERGRPVRDEASTTYTAAIEPSVEFGHRIHGEAMRRGLAHARRVVLLTDGAAYNKTIAAEHFPAAIHIIDLYHAREHLAEFARHVPRVALDSPWHTRARAHLDHGRIEALTKTMREALPRSGPRRAEGLKQINYFRNNAAHMRYAKFRRQGLFVGSGVVEAACRTIVAGRLKRSGMFWSVAGANAILALRCTIQSRQFEQFWEDAA